MNMEFSEQYGAIIIWDDAAFSGQHGHGTTT